MASQSADWAVIKQHFAKLRKDCNVFGIIVIGETGSGKSALVNNLVGKDVVEEGNDLESKTATICNHNMIVEGVPVSLYDTPGLDGSHGDRDASYLRDIERILKSGEIQLVIYCLKLTETRMRGGLIRTFQQFNKIGVRWEQTVIALTFADSMPMPSTAKNDAKLRRQYFDDKVKGWHDKLKSTLKNQVKLGEEVHKISVRPTTAQFDERLPNGKRWYSPIWLDILERLTPAAMSRYIEMHKRNFSHGSNQKIRIEFDDEDMERFERVVKGSLLSAGLFATGAGVGAAIGSIFPGPGTVVGGFIGAGVGLSLSAMILSLF